MIKTYDDVFAMHSDPEIWEWIPGFETHYKISNYGRVTSYKKDKEGAFLKPKINKAGYWYIVVPTGKVTPRVKAIGIGRLVATVFVPNPEDHPEVDHIDNQKWNNHHSNLQWINHDHNVKKDQAYMYKVWNINDPDNVIWLESKRQVEEKVGKSYGWLAYRLGVPDVPSRDGWMCESKRLKGSEKQRW